MSIYEGVSASDSAKAETYRDIARIQLDAGDFAGAQETAAKISEDESYYKESIYLDIAKAHLKAGNLAAAKTAIARCTRSIPSDVVEVYTLIVTTQVKAGDIAGAKETTKQINIDIDDGFDASDTKAKLYRSIVETQAEMEGGGDFAGAKETLVFINPDTLTYVTTNLEKVRACLAIAEAQAKAGGEKNMAEANEMIELAKATAPQIQVFPQNKAQAYLHIAATYVKLSDMAKANEMFELAKKADAGPRTHNDIAEAQANAGNIADAKATAAQIKDTRYRHWAYLHILKLQLQAGDFPGAKATASLITETPEDIYTKSNAYLAIVEAQIKAGDFAGAKEMALHDSNKKEYALYCIVWAQADAGDIAGAMETASLADDCYKPIFYALMEKEDFDGAKALIPHISEEEYYDAYYNQIITKAQTKTGDFTAALDALANLKSIGWRFVRHWDWEIQSPF